MRNKTIGILGGMGPEATVDFMSKVIKATPAKIDQDHIRMLVDNNPQIPPRVEAILNNGPSPGPVMAKMAKRLEMWGAELLVIPCNTAHYYLDQVLPEINIPVLNMIDETLEVIKGDGKKKIALLATTATLKTKLYDEKLLEEGICLILPDENTQEWLVKAIKNIKAADFDQAGVLIGKVIEALREKDVEGIILGCTELPLVIDVEGLTSTDHSIKFYDPAQILARAVVQKCYQKVE